MRRFMKTLAVLAVGTATLIGASAQAQDKKYTIALIPGLTTDAFYITMRKGAEAAAKALGAELVFQGAPEFNPVAVRWPSGSTRMMPTGLVVCAVWGPLVVGSHICSQLPWSALTISVVPVSRQAASTSATPASTVSTAFFAASSEPVCPTMSGLA